MSVTVGDDEFCMNCMEWRSYDENGKCVVCGKRIKNIKKKTEQVGYGESEKVDFINDSEAE